MRDEANTEKALVASTHVVASMAHPRSPCEACASRVARLYCAADDAKLCLRCDRAVRARDVARARERRESPREGTPWARRVERRIPRLTRVSRPGSSYAQVHGANKFAERHVRRWLCGTCSHASAEVRLCVNEGRRRLEKALLGLRGFVATSTMRGRGRR